MIRTAASLSLTALAVGLGTPAAARQSVPVPPPASVQPIDPAADRLAEDMRRLAANPRDVEALASAGRGALAMGDANGALGFFLRMQAAAPRDGRAQAGMGSALLELERPAEALRLFDEAQRLGLAEAGFAADRGLAYDLLGETARAQRDYQIALARGREDETVRRYALSLGIAGRTQEAMAELDPLLRRQDRGAWRARAFILAMGGDPVAAQGVAQQTLPAPMAQMLQPYLRQLATIRSPGARAFAVHYGQLGGNVAALARRNATLPPGTPARAAPVALAMRAAATTTATMPSAAPAGAATGAAATPPARFRGRATRAAGTAAGPIVVERGAPRPSRSPTRARDARGDPRPVEIAAVDRRRLAPPVPVRAPVTTAVPAPAVASSPAPIAAPAPAPAAVPSAAAATPAPGFGGGVAGGAGAASVPAASVAAPAVATPAPMPAAPAPITAVPAPAIVRPVAGPPAADGSGPRSILASAGPAAAVAPGFVTAAPVPVVAPPVAAPAPATPVAAVPLRSDPAARAQALAGIMAGLEIPTVELAARPVADAGAVRAAADAAARRRREALAAERAAADARRKADIEAKRKADAEAARKAAEAAARARPERHWVQVATGADPAQLSRDLRRIAARAPVLKDRKGWSAKFGGTRRLLVGPFATAREAVQFMQKAKAAGVDGFNWTSPEGADVDPLPGA